MTTPANTASPASAGVPAVGEPAPDFTLESTSGQKVTLSQYRGKREVLLAFFPLAFTSTCTAEMCEFETDWDRFASGDVEVIPISVDSVPTLREFKSKYNIRAEMLSDFRRDVSRQYGVLLPEKFYSNRAYFLVDREGVLRWAHVEEHPGKKRDTAEILRVIDDL